MPVPLRLVLARTDEVAVAVLGVTAFKEGIEFRVSVRRRPRPQVDEGSDYDLDPFWRPFGHLGRVNRPGELPPEMLRFGVQFSDGRKATTTGQVLPDPPLSKDERPAGPFLMPGGGSGGGSEGQSDFWLWPLPPPGSFAFVVEWPSEQIELSQSEVDASLFIEASSQSEVLWPEDDRGGGGAWSAVDLDA